MPKRRRRAAASTPQPVQDAPPASRRQRRAATAAKSTTPVSGEWSAGHPAACGSISRSSSAPRRRSPGTPLARPRRSSSSSAGELALVARRRSACRSAQRRSPCSSQNRTARGALDAEPGLERARRVVDAGVDDAAVVARLVAAIRSSRSSTAIREPRVARSQLPGDRQPEDPGADDGDVDLGRRLPHPACFCGTPLASSSRSASTISRTSSSKLVRGSQPSFSWP